MKRKLNEANVPEGSPPPSEAPQRPTFDSFGLSPQLLRALIRQKYATPTPVQAKVLPAALQGKDILARSKTGSGKTAAYALPLLQAIVSRKAAATTSAQPEKAVAALVLVPTRELAGQVTKAIEAFAEFCAQLVRVENLTRKEDDRVQRARLAGLPDVVVATPGRAAAHVNLSSLSLEKLTHLVIDEADLVLSYGYEDDLKAISRAMPKGVQSILMSATLRDDVDTLKGMFCRNPVSISLDEEEKNDTKVSQYIVKCAEDEKFLLCYAIFILKLIKGKIIIFVGDIDRCYRLKLFLEQFGIRSCVLNSELPVNSRIHVVEEFNKNVYDIIIATDENEIVGKEFTKKRKDKKIKTDLKMDTAEDGNQVEAANQDATKEQEEEPEENQENDVAEPAKKKRKGPKADKDYGVARGIDFKNVACVLNFDLPTTSKSYTHRIGRTARAGKTGMALSFVIPKEQYRKHKHTSTPSTEHDEAVLAQISAHQASRGQTLAPYAFDMAKLAGFRYRLADALKAVTPGAIREARVRELRQELVRSEKLKRHFEENPDELRHLRHDGELRAAKVRPHLKHVPPYLLPGGAQKTLESEVGPVGPYRGGEEKSRRRGRKFRAGNKRPIKKVNPLQTFKAKAR